MFCRYSGYGNSCPSVLTVATSCPVDGASPLIRCTGAVLGAASRFLVSAFGGGAGAGFSAGAGFLVGGAGAGGVAASRCRSEEHTSELQSHVNLVCRLLLE